MKRAEFLEKLISGLSTLTPDERSDILNDYTEHFSAGEAEGKTEEEICNRLGDPKALAEDYLDGRQDKAGPAKITEDIYSSDEGKSDDGSGNSFEEITLISKDTDDGTDTDDGADQEIAAAPETDNQPETGNNPAHAAGAPGPVTPPIAPLKFSPTNPNVKYRANSDNPGDIPKYAPGYAAPQSKSGGDQAAGIVAVVCLSALVVVPVFVSGVIPAYFSLWTVVAALFVAAAAAFVGIGVTAVSGMATAGLICLGIGLIFLAFSVSIWLVKLAKQIVRFCKWYVNWCKKTCAK